MKVNIVFLDHKNEQHNVEHNTDHNLYESALTEVMSKKHFTTKDPETSKKTTRIVKAIIKIEEL